MYNAPQIDFLGMFLAAQNARAQREQMNMARERQDMEMQQFREQKAQQAQLGEAKKQYFSGGDSKLLQMMSPELYGQYEQQKRDAAKFDAEQRMGAIDENKKKELLAAGYQNALANASPEQRPAIEQKMFELTQAGMLPRVEVTGPDSSKQNIADIAGSADATNQIYGEKKDPKTTNDMVEFQSISGLSPGDPGWGKGFAKYQVDMANARKPVTNINNGPTTRTQTNVEGNDIIMGEAAPFIESLDSYGSLDAEAKIANRIEDGLREAKFTLTDLSPAETAAYKRDQAIKADWAQLMNIISQPNDEGKVDQGLMAIAMSKEMGMDAKYAAIKKRMAARQAAGHMVMTGKKVAAPMAQPTTAAPSQPAPIDLQILQTLNPGAK